MSKIEIIIDKVKDGNDTHLSSLSINETSALIEILTALKNIAIHENKSDIKIGVKEGSACALLDAETQTIEEIHSSMLKVVHNSADRDNVYVKNLQIIKDQIEGKNLEMKIIYRKGDDVHNIRDYFNVPFRIRKTRGKRESSFYLDFFEGKVKDSGGDNPNFHIELQDIVYTITSTHKQASDAAKFLYGDIKVAVWGKADSEGKLRYTCADIYVEQDILFSEMKMFYNNFAKLEEVDKIKLIHTQLQEYYSDRNFGMVRKFIRLFIWDESEPGYLLAILLISKAFRNHEDVSDLLIAVEEKLATITKRPVL